jgi:hypothetical protein
MSGDAAITSQAEGTNDESVVPVNAPLIRAAGAASPQPDFFEVLSQLYDSKIQINVSASSFWDGGCSVTARDARDGTSVTRQFEHLQDAGPWLIKFVEERYPGAGFARRLRGQQRSA